MYAKYLAYDKCCNKYFKAKLCSTKEQPTNHLRWVNSPKGQSSDQSGMGLRREDFLGEVMLELSFKAIVSTHQGGNEVCKAPSRLLCC